MYIYCICIGCVIFFLLLILSSEAIKRIRIFEKSPYPNIFIIGRMDSGMNTIILDIRNIYFSIVMKKCILATDLYSKKFKIVISNLQGPLKYSPPPAISIRSRLMLLITLPIGGNVIGYCKQIFIFAPFSHLLILQFLYKLIIRINVH